LCLDSSASASPFDVQPQYTGIMLDYFVKS
jgi:hypothetical protein